MSGKEMLICAAVLAAAAALVGAGVWLHAAASNDDDDSSAASGSGGSGGWVPPSEAIANLESHGGYIYTMDGSSCIVAASDTVTHSDGTITVRSPNSGAVRYVPDFAVRQIQTTY